MDMMGYAKTNDMKKGKTMTTKGQVRQAAKWARLLFVWFFLPSVFLYGQSPSWNYVLTRTMLDSVGTSWAVSVGYTDDYGRLSQRVVSSEQGHLCEKRDYDGAGRDHRRWLPVPVGSASPDAVPYFHSVSLATYGEDYALSETRYDALGRAVSTRCAGDLWYEDDKAELRSYRVNAPSSVRRYTAPLDAVSLVKDGYVPGGTLSSVLVTDEDGHTTETFRDVLGRIVLERRSGVLDTYYVYDDLGRLRYVLPPQYQDNQTKASFAYDYRYNSLRQMEKRKLPGCGTEQYWYDRPSDRVRFMRDAELSSSGVERFWLYDALGRVAVQGTCVYGNHGDYPVSARYGEGGTAVMGTGYFISKSNFASGMRLESAHYYDSYDFLGSPVVSATGRSGSLSVAAPCCARGLETGTVEIASNGDTIVTVYYYDWRGRMSQRRRSGPGDMTTVTSWERSFTGEVTRERVTVLRHGAEAHDAFTSHTLSPRTGRPVSTTVCAGGRTQRTSLLSFDALDRVSSDERGGIAGSVVYGYDTRGWTTAVSSRHFSERFHYADGPGSPCYNGDISSLTWHCGDSVVRGYRFAYDSAGRMSSAVYGEGDAISGEERYSERAVYNKNGCPTLIERNSVWGGHAAVSERISLVYTGNRLSSASLTSGNASPAYGRMCFADNVSLGSGEYGYDGCGRLSYDRNKEITYIG